MSTDAWPRIYICSQAAWASFLASDMLGNTSATTGVALQMALSERPNVEILSLFGVLLADVSNPLIDQRSAGRLKKMCPGHRPPVIATTRNLSKSQAASGYWVPAKIAKPSVVARVALRFGPAGRAATPTRKGVLQNVFQRP